MIKMRKKPDKTSNALKGFSKLIISGKIITSENKSSQTKIGFIYGTRCLCVNCSSMFDSSALR